MNFAVREKRWQWSSQRPVLIQKRLQENWISGRLGEQCTPLVSGDQRKAASFSHGWAQCQPKSRYNLDCSNNAWHVLFSSLFIRGPSEKGQNSTCSYFLSGKTRHWTAVRLKHLLLTINLRLVWTPTWKFSEKSTGWLQEIWARSDQIMESNKLSFMQCLSY